MLNPLATLVLLIVPNSNVVGADSGGYIEKDETRMDNLLEDGYLVLIEKHNITGI